jgi:hypothetical protein
MSQNDSPLKHTTALPEVGLVMSHAYQPSRGFDIVIVSVDVPEDHSA